MPTEPVTTCDINTNSVVRRLPNGCKSILFVCFFLKKGYYNFR
jgi:hypothetical protein